MLRGEDLYVKMSVNCKEFSFACERRCNVQISRPHVKVIWEERYGRATRFKLSHVKVKWEESHGRGIKWEESHERGTRFKLFWKTYMNNNVKMI